MKMVMNKFWLILIILTVSISCSEHGEIYMTPIDNLWKKDNNKVLEFEIHDSQTPKNITFIVRHNNEYPYSNLFLISSVKNPKNEIVKTDTLQYILAKPNGEWLGNGFGSVKEILLLYKNNYLFPNNGKYQIEIKHGMRADELKGMEDIGIKIENVN